jgi:hypothetical protein
LPSPEETHNEMLLTSLINMTLLLLCLMCLKIFFFEFGVGHARLIKDIEKLDKA